MGVAKIKLFLVLFYNNLKAVINESKYVLLCPPHHKKIGITRSPYWDHRFSRTIDVHQRANG
ncbi:hypothetical protein ACLOJK_025064 [Asimina triloba]